MSERWHGADAEAVSLAWEAAHGCDSIPTIERVYQRSHTGAFVCPWPSCPVKRHDSDVMWRHVHTAHGRSDLPPDDFDPGPWL